MMNKPPIRRLLPHLERKSKISMAILLLLISACSAPEKKEEPQTSVTHLDGFRQNFILSFEIERAKLAELSQFITTDLQESLSQIQDIRSVRFFSSFGDSKTAQVSIIFEITSVSGKGINVDSSGSVQSVDVSSFLFGNLKDDPAIRKLLSWKDVVSTSSLKAYNENYEISFDRSIVAIVKK